MLISGGWAAAIAGWLTYKTTIDGNAATSCRARREQLERLARTIGVDDPWAVSAEQLAGWFARQPWRTETKRSRRTTLRGFYAWGVLKGHVVESPALALPRVRPAVPNPMPVPDQVLKPALAIAPPRERLMMRLAVKHGMRRGEIAQVWPERDMIPDLEGWSLIVHGKGGKERIIPLVDEDAATLLALGPGWAFPGSIDGHLSPRWVGTLVNRLLFDEWTVHKLRHRAATEWWEHSDHDLFVCQDLLGHASPATTRLYVKVADSRKRDTVRRAAA